MAKAAARLSRAFPKAAQAEEARPYTSADEEDAIRRACEASLAAAQAAPKGAAGRGGWQDDDLAAALEASRREAEARAQEEEELARVLALSRKLHRRGELEEDSLALALAESKRDPPPRPLRPGAPASPTNGGSAAASSSSGGTPPAGKGKPATDPKLVEAIQHTAMATLLARSDGRRGSSWDPAPEPEEPETKARALDADHDAFDAELKAALAASAAEAEALRKEEMEDKLLMEAIAASRRMEEEEAAYFECEGGSPEPTWPTKVAAAPSDAGSAGTGASFERIEDWPLPGPIAQAVASFAPATGSSSAGATSAAAVRPQDDEQTAPAKPGPTAASDAAGASAPATAAGRCAEFDMAAFDADEGAEDGAQEGPQADELEWHDGLDLWWAAEGCLVDAADVQPAASPSPPGPPAQPSGEETPHQEDEDDAGWTLVES